MKLKFTYKGGPGSGHHGHAGIPGKVGGSLPGKGTGGADKYPKANPNGVDTFEQYRNPDGTWTKERQALHDSIKAKFFEGKSPVDNPQSFMMGGGPAAGKSTLLNSGLVDVPENSVLAAGDDIKGMLPEYEGGNAPFVHEESSYLAKQIMEEASSKSYNVIFDGTGDGGIKSVQSKVDKLSMSGQPVHGLYVTVDTDTASQRAIARANATGRYIPDSVLRANHAAVSAIFPTIVAEGGLASVSLYDTNSGKAILIASAIGPKLTIHDQDLYDNFLNKAK
jgi:hypothetical protein